MVEMAEVPTNLSQSKYRPDIDGLRAVAVLAVIFFHAFPKYMRGGFIGVDIFFVISGYLITTIILEGLDGGSFSFSGFYSRRVRRIFPALIVVLVASLVFGWSFLLADELNQLGKHAAAGAGFISNFTLWSEVGYFDNLAETKPLLHLWSLAIEEQFYIFWPVLLWFAWKRKFNLLTVTIVIFAVSFFLGVRGASRDMVAAFYSPQTRFWELLSGGILAWGTLYKKDSATEVKHKIGAFLSRLIYREKQDDDRQTLADALSIAGLLLLLYGFWGIKKELIFPGTWALVPVLGAVLIIAAGDNAWVNRTILSSKVAVWLGLLSFPLYLWHWPLLTYLRMAEGEVPSYAKRTLAVLLAVFLAWLTVRFIEKPIRFGSGRNALRVSVLCGVVFLIGLVGYLGSRADFSHSHRYEKLAVKRNGSEHAFGSSLYWYEGKQDWLFLGNGYQDTVAKLKLAIVPSDEEMEARRATFSRIAEAGAKYGAKSVLFLGPNKSNVYPEYLPEGLRPSPVRYASYFLDKLKGVPNLTVYDPTAHMLASKKSQGLLYWMTDTHWNDKGAFVAYADFAKSLGLPIPLVEFKQGAVRSGDLIDIAKLKNYPLHAEDNWDVVWKNKPSWIERETPNDQTKRWGAYPATVVNENPLSGMYVWVVGDSFTSGLRQYFNATFKETRYFGHWEDKHEEIPDALDKADRKPQMIIIVLVERNL